MRVIDFHTHAFPDELAASAIPRLETEGNIEAQTDGTVGALLQSMERAGIERSVVASIATRPSQFDAILRWSSGIASERIVPFPSVHPGDPDALPHLRAVARGGFRGIKLHPYYQDFSVDDERLFPFYQEIQTLGLVLLCHAGFDMAYERRRIADPVRFARISRLFPALKLVATHLGAWEDWDEVERHLLGLPVSLDLSYIYGFLEAQRARRMILDHPSEHLLFGTDSPWADQADVLARTRELDLPEERLRALLYGNAARLLGIQES